jgi:hypothetical protein
MKILIDDEDLPIYRSYAQKSCGWRINSNGYIVCNIDGEIIFLHRLLAGFDRPKINVRFINGNKLDCRKVNLRIGANPDRKKTYRLAHPEKAMIEKMTSHAKRMGRLVPKPCAICGAPAEVHHPSYKHAYEVIWLCHKHHLELHRWQHVETNNNQLLK